MIHILMIVDRSGSMAMTKRDAEGGIKTFFDTQRETGLDIRVGLAQFDHEFQWITKGDPLVGIVEYNLIPRGSTALFDAVGRGVTEYGEYLAASNAPVDRVICVVVTDGQENSSIEWNQSRVTALIEQQKNEWSWEFVFLAADPTTVRVGRDMGTQSMGYTPDSHGTRTAYAAAGQSISSALRTNTSVQMPEQARGEEGEL